MNQTDEIFYFQDYLHGCLMQIEDMVTATINTRANTSSSQTGMAPSNPAVTTSVNNANNNTSNVTSRQGNTTSDLIQNSVSVASDKVLEHEKAGTPTDVRDVHF